MLINGVPGDSISINDRGFMYGDGVFRTMLVKNGLVQSWPRHFNKLKQDCIALNLDCPEESILIDELAQLTKLQVDGVAKITITRGISTRGYTPPQHPLVTRVVSITPAPEYSTALSKQGVRVHQCRLQLCHQPLLAGIKHLNRLENVLAAAEFMGSEMHEGILLDKAGFVIEATRSNVFMVRDGALFTPDLSNCGVAGVQRERVIDWAQQNSVPCSISNIALEDMLVAEEIFLVNSIIGLWPVREIRGFQREHHPVSQRIQHWLNHENN
jgi:4-amino-4-deoxychorismate lyase